MQRIKTAYWHSVLPFLTAMPLGTDKIVSRIIDKSRTEIKIDDSVFIYLRIVLLCGGIGWMFFADISEQTFNHVASVFSYFAVYSLFTFLWLYVSPHKERQIYAIALVFDLVYTSLLVGVTGGFASSFFNAYYLITALYSFYFGIVPGALIASLSALLYFMSGGQQFTDLHWTDFAVRIAFLFLLSVPLSIISQKLRDDKERIENLNKDLNRSIEEVQSMQGKLIQAEKLTAIGRLTADVAHEIRNPLTSMGGFARRLFKKLAPGSREKEYAEIVVEEVVRLERILQDVLTFSSEKKMELKYQKVEGVLKDSLCAYKGVCSDQYVEIAAFYDQSLPEVLIDAGQLRLAFDNIISNAIDAMPDGGKLSVKTYMKEQCSVNYVTVEVSDTGEGLPEGSINMIFEPFVTTKEVGRGTGLGLAICKKIMDEHHGLMLVDSSPGQGATFRMLFPYQDKKDAAKISCWDFHKCGVEKTEGAANMRCPAYPDYVRVCWAIAGTYCGRKVSGAIAQKLGNCSKCKFYAEVTGIAGNDSSVSSN